MGNLKIGDKVGLDWVKGCGNAKVLAVYQNYVMVIHLVNNKPFVVHKKRLTAPEKSPQTGFIFSNG